MLQARDAKAGLTKNIKNVIDNAFDGFPARNVRSVGPSAESVGVSYAAVARAGQRLPENVPSETSFYVIPDTNYADKFISAQVTKEVTCSILKPSDCGLRLNSISFARNNAIKIRANSPDLDKLRRHPGLIEAGLKVVEKAKLNPRIIVRGIPAGMSAEEVKDELILQNLSNIENIELKVVYIFPTRTGRKTTSCILEISADTRNVLRGKGKLYLRFYSYTMSDDVRVLQCYRYLAFGHLARNCESEPRCGNCAEAHELRDCEIRNQLKCGNCIRTGRFASADSAHSALDYKKCPILVRKFKEIIADTNYG